MGKLEERMTALEDAAGTAIDAHGKAVVRMMAEIVRLLMARDLLNEPDVRNHLLAPLIAEAQALSESPEGADQAVGMALGRSTVVLRMMLFPRAPMTRQ